MEPSPRERLVGVWSADARYGPGAQSDEVLWLRSDGSGRRDFYNFVLCTVEYFAWEALAADRLAVSWDRELQWDGETIEESPLRGIQHFSFAIADEPIPAGGTTEVLRIDLGLQEGAFARIPSMDATAFDDPQLGM